MGMYTEIYVNVDLKKETPDDVIQVLKAMVGHLLSVEEYEVLKDYPPRWSCLFSDMSYYTPRTHCRYLHFDKISNAWSLLGKGDIKNYANEIEEFFEWITPWVDGYPGDFIGYKRYEDDMKPTLYFLPDDEDDDEDED